MPPEPPRRRAPAAEHSEPGRTEIAVVPPRPRQDTHRDFPPELPPLPPVARRSYSPPPTSAAEPFSVNRKGLRISWSAVKPLLPWIGLVLFGSGGFFTGRFAGW